MLLLSACVDRVEPERPIEELPDSEQPTASFALASDVTGETVGTYSLVATLSAPAAANTSLSLTTSGSASSADYVLPGGAIPVPAGARSVPIPIQILADGIDEGSETIVVAIADSFNLKPSATNSTFTLTIVDNLPVVRFGATAGIAAEADGTYPVEILFSTPALTAGSITLSTSGSVNPAVDLVGFTTSIPFNAGADRVVLELEINDDGVDEGTETLNLTMETVTGGQVSQAQGMHTLTLLPARPKVRFSSDQSFSAENTTKTDLRISTDIPAPVGFTIALTTSGTASVGTDVIVEQTLHYPAGATAIALPVTFPIDDVVEGAERLVLTLNASDPAILDTEHSTHALFILSDTPLNDTGVLTFASESSSLEPAEPEPAPGQDAKYGRDAKAGAASFNFIKLDMHGNPLPDTAVEWACVRDNVTGTIWEVKGPYYDLAATNGLPDDSIKEDELPTIPAELMRAHNFRYTWYSEADDQNGGSRGAVNADERAELNPPIPVSCRYTAKPPKGTSTRTYTPYCNSDVYIKENNAYAFCGRTNWRLPSYPELESMANFSELATALPTKFFEPGTQGDPVLSSTTVPGAPATVFCFDPLTKTAKQCLKNVPGFVRLVSDLLDTP